MQFKFFGLIQSSIQKAKIRSRNTQKIKAFYTLTKQASLHTFQAPIDNGLKHEANPNA
jgi:hypothetical protein